MSKKQITITIDAEAAEWLAEEVSSHFYYGQMEIQDWEHFMPMVTVYRALIDAGTTPPESESEKYRRAMKAREAAEAGDE